MFNIRLREIRMKRGFTQQKSADALGLAEMASTLETVEVELIHVDSLNQILYDGLFLYGNLGDG